MPFLTFSVAISSDLSLAAKGIGQGVEKGDRQPSVWVLGGQEGCVREGSGDLRPAERRGD